MKQTNQFFATEAEARAFRKALIKSTLIRATGHKDRFLAEMTLAFEERREIVDPEKTPICVSWYYGQPRRMLKK